MCAGHHSLAPRVSVSQALQELAGGGVFDGDDGV